MAEWKAEIFQFIHIQSSQIYSIRILPYPYFTRIVPTDDPILNPKVVKVGIHSYSININSSTILMLR
jgi:hypothetical protein